MIDPLLAHLTVEWTKLSAGKVALTQLKFILPFNNWFNLDITLWQVTSILLHRTEQNKAYWFLVGYIAFVTFKYCPYSMIALCLFHIRFVRVLIKVKYTLQLYTLQLYTLQLYTLQLYTISYTQFSYAQFSYTQFSYTQLIVCHSMHVQGNITILLPLVTETIQILPLVLLLRSSVLFCSHYAIQMYMQDIKIDIVPLNNEG